MSVWPFNLARRICQNICNCHPILPSPRCFGMPLAGMRPNGVSMNNLFAQPAVSRWTGHPREASHIPAISGCGDPSSGSFADTNKILSLYAIGLGTTTLHDVGRPHVHRPSLPLLWTCSSRSFDGKATPSVDANNSTRTNNSRSPPTLRRLSIR